MSASRARRIPFVIIFSLTLIVGLVPAAAAADTAPLPSSMAAVGDSITQAASSGGSLGANYPMNSWSTGTNSTVNSHYLRLSALNPAIAGNAYNGSVSGAKVVGLNSQMSSDTLKAIQPDYLTVLIGGNDLCTDTIGGMTEVDDFTGQFRTAMKTLLVGDSSKDIAAVSPDTMVYVVGIPDVHQLWELFKNNFFARAVWSAGNICQSLLANPTSNQTADVERRKLFRERNIAYNTALELVCAEFASRCHYDADNDVFFTKFARSDVSGDYFHPSIAGQAKLAAVSWGVGYTWTSEPSPEPGNQAPTADFTYLCTDLSCQFTDGSTDDDGTVSEWNWDFGVIDSITDTSTEQNPEYLYSAAGTYNVTLTVTDNLGADDTTSKSVTVPSGFSHVGDLQDHSVSGRGQSWSAIVEITIHDGNHALVSGATVSGTWGTGATSSCTTTTVSGSCTVTLEGLNAKKTPSVTFTVDGVAHATLTYNSSVNHDSDSTDGTSITASP